MIRRDSQRGISTPVSVVLIILIVAIGAVSTIVYFTQIDGAQSRTVNNTTEGLTCPEVSGNPTLESFPFGIQVVAQKPVPYQGSGNIVWCTYNKSDGKLEAVYATNRMLSGPIASSDGSYVVANSFQAAPGPSGEDTNGALYLFDKEGQVQWSLPTLQYSIKISGNGSVIVANDPDLLYINNQGQVLWNYSNSTAAALVNNGSEVVDGVSQVLLPNSTNFGSEIILFSSLGRAIWNVSIPNVIFDSTASLAVSDGYIAAGVSYDGSNGTMLYYNLDGALIWSRHVSSSIQQVDFVDNASAILAHTNWGNVTFNLAGNVVQNQTLSEA